MHVPVPAILAVCLNLGYEEARKPFPPIYDQYIIHQVDHKDNYKKYGFLNVVYHNCIVVFGHEDVSTYPIGLRRWPKATLPVQIGHSRLGTPVMRLNLSGLHPLW